MQEIKHFFAICLALLAFLSGGCSVLGLFSALFERPNDMHVTVSLTVYLFIICIAAIIGARLLFRSKSREASIPTEAGHKDRD